MKRGGWASATPGVSYGSQTGRRRDADRFDEGL